MSLHVHCFEGLSPTPLAHYLKALAVFRLIAEQVDPQARAFWREDRFHLVSTLSLEQIEHFFLHDYQPTPMISPWNRGSGFYDKGKEDQPTPLEAIEQSTAPRLERFRAGILDARKQLKAISEAEAYARKMRAEEKAGRVTKAESAAAERAFKKLKDDLYEPILRQWRGPHREWVDTAIILIDGEQKPKMPSLLGTAGNDGKLDFTNRVMALLGDLLDLKDPLASPRGEAKERLHNALYAAPTHGYVDVKIGQFMPGQAGGANSTTGFDSGAHINPWDYVLALEGCLLFRAQATRRLNAQSQAYGAKASAPFTVGAHAAGYASHGHEKSTRGEQWMPLWSQPTTFADLQVFFGEARVQIGKQIAYQPLDAARAVTRFGVERGVTQFIRYSYLNRFGQAHLAIPLGRIKVSPRSSSRLIDDLAPWMDKFHDKLQKDLRNKKKTPASQDIAERRLADTVFAALTHDVSPIRWQSILLAALEVEVLQRAGALLQLGPIPKLRPEWLRAADDGSAEWRLACSLASARIREHHHRQSAPSVRHHWLPLKPNGRALAVSEGRLQKDASVVFTGRDPLGDLSALLSRRVLESHLKGQPSFDLEPRPGFEARPADLTAFLAGALDEARISQLARALMAVDWHQTSSRDWPVAPQSGADLPDLPWIVLRLNFSPYPLQEDRNLRSDEAVLRRLLAEDSAGAIRLALRRLQTYGLRPSIHAAFTDPTTVRRWAAALAFPISAQTTQNFVRAAHPPR